MSSSWKILLPQLFTSMLLIILLGSLKLVEQPTPSAQAQTAGNTWYVSKNSTGTTRNGTSWATAWNDFNEISWASINPGDTIEIDGGSSSNACPPFGAELAGIHNNCGLVYKQTLGIGKSGSGASSRITIKLSDDSGRDGTVIIDGGVVEWGIDDDGSYGDLAIPGDGVQPFYPCYDDAAADEPNWVRSGGTKFSTGIATNSHDWLTIDGRKWGGIVVRNTRTRGITFSDSTNVIAQYIRVHHVADETRGVGWGDGDPSYRSERLIDGGHLSENITLRFTELFRAGQDNIRWAGDGFRLENSYLHDMYCAHPDGIQAHVPTSNSGVGTAEQVVTGLVIKNNWFRQIGLQAIFTGENGPHQSWTDGMLVEDNIFENGAQDHTFFVKTKHANSKNSTIRRNHFIGPNIFVSGDVPFTIQWCCGGGSEGNSVSNNVFYRQNAGGTAFDFSRASATDSNRTTFSNNCLDQTGGGWNTSNTIASGNVSGSALFTSVSSQNYHFGAGSTCSAATHGSQAFQSWTEFVALGNSQVGPIATPAPTPTPSPLASPTTSLNFEAEDGILTAPITDGGTYIYKSGATTTDPALGGKAIYAFNLLSAGNFIVKALVNTPNGDSNNSVFMTIDRQSTAVPTTPTMIWDIPVTNNQTLERTLSWRGTSADPNVPEFAPKVFSLTAGTNYLIVSGRETDTRIDRLWLESVPGGVGLDLQALLGSYALTTTTEDRDGNTKVNMLDAAWVIRQLTASPLPTLPPQPSTTVSDCGVTNFAWSRVNAIARGAQPTVEQINCLAQNGFTTIVRQNQAGETSVSESMEQTAVLNTGMTYVGAYKIPDDTAYSPTMLNTMLTDMVSRINSGQRILVHDTSGRGRMGMWDAVFAMREGSIPPRAIEDRYLAKILPFDGAKIGCTDGGNGQVQALSEIAQARSGSPYFPQVDEYSTVWPNCPRPSYMNGWNYNIISWP